MNFYADFQNGRCITSASSVIWTDINKKSVLKKKSQLMILQVKDFVPQPHFEHIVKMFMKNWKNMSATCVTRLMEIKEIFMCTTNDTIKDTVFVVKVVVNNFVDPLSLGNADIWHF